MIRPPPGMMALLMDQGLTTAWVMDKTGGSRKEALKLLSSLGAARLGHNGYWRLRSHARTMRNDRNLTAAVRAK